MWYLVYTCRFRDCTCTLVDEPADSGALALKCVLVLVRKFLLHLLTPSLSVFLGLYRTAGTFGIAFGSCVFCCFTRTCYDTAQFFALSFVFGCCDRM